MVELTARLTARVITGPRLPVTYRLRSPVKRVHPYFLRNTDLDILWLRNLPSGKTTGKTERFSVARSIDLCRAEPISRILLASLFFRFAAELQ